MKRVLITGGSGGIGEATVTLLAQRGYEVCFTYCSNEKKAVELMESLKGTAGRVWAIQMNLLEPDSIARALTPEIGEDVGFDIVIHNAALTADTNFYFMDSEQWHDVINLSLNSFFYINKLTIPHMIRSRWGRIITLASISGEAGNRGQVNYAAAKGALISASKSLAKELAVKGVLTNVVSPGIIVTDLVKALNERDFKQLIPIGRFGRPGEVAKVIGFLASEDSSYVNGTVIQVNGGMYS